MTCCPNDFEDTMENNPEQELTEKVDAPLQSQPDTEFTRTYVEASHREEEMKSSSFSFLIVAVLLVVVTVLVFLDIIPIATGSPAAKTLDISVLLVMAVIFFAIAMYSMKRAKELSGASNREVALTEEILQYCLEHYRDPASEDSSDTDRYFERENGIRKLIIEQYKGLADSYLEYLVEIVYTELYPDQESVSDPSKE